MTKNIYIISVILLVAIVLAIFLLFYAKDKKNKLTFSFPENAANNIFPENSTEIESEKKVEEPEQKIESQPAQKETAVSPEEDSQKVSTSETKDSSSGIKIKNNLVNWGFAGATGRKIDTVIVHSSYNSLGGDEYSVNKLIDIYKKYEVAPHYLIDRKGAIYLLVEEKNIAYHAGVSQVPDGRENVNGFSIGIEIMENKTDGPSAQQYAALKNLIADIKSRYKIKYVLGHNQIAPGRKDDPWNFDWGKL